MSLQHYLCFHIFNYKFIKAIFNNGYAEQQTCTCFENLIANSRKQLQAMPNTSLNAGSLHCFAVPSFSTDLRLLVAS